VLVIANQKPGVVSEHGITREEADRSAWAVDRSGRRWEGVAAINRVMRELGGYPSWIAAAYRFKPIAAIEDSLYRWFAPRRARFGRFGSRPECDEPGSGCD
jgi:predicted DCC family thiol-disulfide oxidoreductase YuxK